LRFRAGVTYADTRLQLEGIRHILENALNANQRPIDLDDKWPRNDDNSVRDKGVCWLYCWATTGAKSHDAAAIAASRRIFNAIFNFDYNAFHDFVNSKPEQYKWAKKERYLPGCNFADELTL
jgi:hypothetical protein